MTRLWVQPRGRVDGGLNEGQPHRWLGAVRFGTYLNIELATFPDGLTVSCKRERPLRSPELPSTQMAVWGWEVYPFSRAVVASYHKVGWLNATATYCLTVLEA